MRGLVSVAIAVALLGQSAGLAAFDCPGGASESCVKPVAVGANSPDLKAHHCAGGTKAAQIESTTFDLGAKRERADGFRAKFSYLAESAVQDPQSVPLGFTNSSPPKLYAHSPPLFILHASLLI